MQVGLISLALAGACVIGVTSAAIQPRVTLVSLSAAQLPIESQLPGFDGAIEWINSPALSVGALRGKVVLIDFWTYTCINWRRTLPYVSAWADKYQHLGVVVVGVHTPEFSFEKNLVATVSV
jgi:thiol-disulfide isomerase/thioredoxin